LIKREKKIRCHKKKCRDVLKTLKKFCFYFYDVKFILKTDVRMFVDQLNWFDTDLFDALVTRWLVWIRLFDFEIRHVLDIKHIAANDLFKKFSSFNDLKKVAEKKNINDWMNIQFDCVRLFFISIAEEKSFSILIFEYFEKSQKIVVYLFTLRKSFKMSLKEFNKFKKKILKFKLQRNQLFRRNSKNVFMKKVIDDLEKRQRILKQLHDESDHRDKKNIYKRIINRYWWNDLYDDVQKYVKTCSQCQLRNFIKEKETLHSIWITLLWKKWKWRSFTCRQIKRSIIWSSLAMIFSNEQKHAFYLKRKLDEWQNFFEKT
jgi:hypothetical protein